MRVQNKDDLTSNEIKKLLNKMVNMYDILNEAGYKINAYGNSFCPFHDNEDTPSAKYYPTSDTLFCFSEGKVYSAIDALRLAGKNYVKVFYDRWDTYSDKEKENLLSSIEETVVEDKIAFKSSLNDFKNGKCTYEQLCVDIAKSSKASIGILEALYKASHRIDSATVGSNDYVYIAWRCNINHIRLLSVRDIVKNKIKLPTHLTKFFERNTDTIIIFNMCGKVPLSCIIRSIKTKQFTNIGNAALLYGICSLNKDFKYGDRITLVEGPKDCEVYRNIFNDKNCLATNTAPISYNKAQLLRYVTNDIVLAQDNDKPGTDAKNNFKNQYSSDFKINEFKHDDSLKDFGDLIPLLRRDYPKALSTIKKYKIRINNFI